MGQIKKQNWESIIINPKTGFKTGAVSHQWKWHLNWMQIGWILTMKNDQWQITLGDLFLEKNRRDFCFRKFSHQTTNCYNFWKLSNIFLPIPGFSMTTTQIQGLSRAWNFFPQFQDFLGFSRTMATLLTIKSISVERQTDSFVVTDTMNILGTLVIFSPWQCRVSYHIGNNLGQLTEKQNNSLLTSEKPCTIRN